MVHDAGEQKPMALLTSVKARVPLPRAGLSVHDQVAAAEHLLVIAIVSADPGSPLSVVFTCNVAFPSTGCGAAGFVMSWMFAFPSNVVLFTLTLSEVTRPSKNQASILGSQSELTAIRVPIGANREYLKQ
jgi:hypothetical protein